MNGGWVTRRVRQLAWVSLGASLSLAASGCKSKTDASSTPSATPKKPSRPSTRSSASAAPGGSVGSPGAAASGSAAPAPSASAAASESAKLPRVEVDLVDAGKPPLRQLRYKLAEGQKVRWTEVSSESVEYQNLKIAGHPMPSVRWVYELTANEPFEAGVARVQVRVVEGGEVAVPGLPPKWAKYVPKMNDARRRASLSGTLTETGRWKPDAYSPPDGTDDDLRDVLKLAHEDLGAAFFPVPERPIGVGARWTVMRRFTSRTVQFRELTVYELLKLDDDRIEFDGLVSASAPPTQLDVATLPPGHTMELVRLSTLGKVRGVLTLDHPVPSVRSEWATKMSVKVRHVDDIVGEGTVVFTGRSTSVPEGMPTPPPIVDGDELETAAPQSPSAAASAE
jgi:hypothetical protein